MGNKNFFSMFDLPISYNIDENALRVAYFEKQRQLHPDFCNNNMKDTEGHEEITITDVNVAYECLTDPIARAEHFLELQNFSAKYDVFTDFADEMFEIRRTYASLEQESEKNIFFSSLKARMSEIIGKLHDFEDDLKKFRAYTGLLRFINSFLEKAESNVYGRD